MTLPVLAPSSAAPECYPQVSLTAMYFVQRAAHHGPAARGSGPSLVLRRLLSVVDDKMIDRVSAGLQLEPQLFRMSAKMSVRL